MTPTFHDKSPKEVADLIFDASSGLMNCVKKGRDSLIRAIEFGRYCHKSIDQKRKYTGEPYYEHTEAVAYDVALNLKHTVGAYRYALRSGMGIANLATVIAALEHDILEDVFPNVSPARKIEINKGIDTFPLSVRDFVNSLTDIFTSENYPELNRKHRKLLEASRLGQTDMRTQLIKLCDIKNNTFSIVQHDPGFAVTYLKEKDQLLALLTKAPKALRDAVITQLKEEAKKLDIKLTYF